jgi:hypothetical protein
MHSAWKIVISRVAMHSTCNIVVPRGGPSTDVDQGASDCLWFLVGMSQRIGETFVDCSDPLSCRPCKEPSGSWHGSECSPWSPRAASAAATVAVSRPSVDPLPAPSHSSDAAQESPRNLDAQCMALGASKPVILGTHKSPIGSLAIDSTTLFALSEYSGGYAIHRIAKDGSGVRLLTKFVTVRTDRIAVDSTGIYFSKRTVAS